jgi:hypothetical protein
MMEAGVIARIEEMVATAAILATISACGCVNWSLKDDVAGRLDAKIKQDEIVRASPWTTLWIENESQNDIVEREVAFESATHGRDCSGHVAGQTQGIKPHSQGEVWRQQWPDPLIIKSITLRTVNGGSVAYPVQFTCNPGEKVILHVDAKMQGKIRAERYGE